MYDRIRIRSMSVTNLSLIDLVAVADVEQRQDLSAASNLVSLHCDGDVYGTAL